jgi:hypothetical protein
VAMDVYPGTTCALHLCAAAPEALALDLHEQQG